MPALCDLKSTNDLLGRRAVRVFVVLSAAKGSDLLLKIKQQDLLFFLVSKFKTSNFKRKETKAMLNQFSDCKQVVLSKH